MDFEPDLKSLGNTGSKNGNVVTYRRIKKLEMSIAISVLGKSIHIREPWRKSSRVGVGDSTEDCKQKFEVKGSIHWKGEHDPVFKVFQGMNIKWSDERTYI